MISEVVRNRVSAWSPPMVLPLRLTIGIAQSVIVRILHKHVGEFDFGAVHVLTGDDHGEFVVHQPGVMSEDVSDLGREVGRESG